MRVPQIQIRKADVAVGAAFVVLAIVLMVQVAPLGPGWGEGGPQPGFFPFSVAVLMALGGLAAALQALRSEGDRLFFEHPQEVADLLKVGIPLALAIASVPYLGLYIMTALYLTFFARWYGRFRWYSAAAAGVGFSYALYLTLHQYFHIATPRSMWYGTLLPF
ncbi:MAG: tripartite tricarboxylate transporter TctB family protein [Nitrospinota bacterium]